MKPLRRPPANGWLDDVVTVSRERFEERIARDRDGHRVAAISQLKNLVIEFGQSAAAKEAEKLLKEMPKE